MISQIIFNVVGDSLLPSQQAFQFLEMQTFSGRSSQNCATTLSESRFHSTIAAYSQCRQILDKSLFYVHNCRLFAIKRNVGKSWVNLFSFHNCRLFTIKWNVGKYWVNLCFHSNCRLFAMKRNVGKSWVNLLSNQARPNTDGQNLLKFTFEGRKCKKKWNFERYLKFKMGEIWNKCKKLINFMFEMTNGWNIRIY